MNSRLSFFTFTFIFLCTQIFSQVPNSSFEQWTNGEPDGWFTNNLVIGNLVNLVTVTQSSDAHSGSSSLRGEVVNYNNGVYASILTAGKFGGASGFPISQNYASISGYYKLNSVQGDKLDVIVVIMSNGDGIALGAQELPAASGYTNFNIPINYNSIGGTADTCLISITFANDTARAVHAGSVFYIDDLSLSGNATSVKEPAKTITSFKLDQNYPNPFNPSTKISWQSPIAGWQSLKVYDILGNEVATLINGYRPAGKYSVEFNSSVDGNRLSSGVYFYQLKSWFLYSNKKNDIDEIDFNLPSDVLLSEAHL